MGLVGADGVNGACGSAIIIREIRVIRGLSLWG